MVWLFIFFVHLAQAENSEGQNFRFETITQQSDVIWGFDFLPDQRIVFTERKGALKIFDLKTSKVKEIAGAPAVWNRGQGGLLDVRFYKNKIYLSYAKPVGNGATTALASATLTGDKLTDLKELFAAYEAHNTGIHFGSRIEFDNNGHIFLSVGERNQRPQVQDMKFHMGKIVRMNMDGSSPTIWSYGHRNPQGLVRNAKTGELWEAEMGPQGGDELNLIKQGANYGWPTVTYGREYTGAKIGEPTAVGVEAPVAYWVPSISPSGITIYTGSVFSKWQGNIFIATLSGQHLHRVVLNGTKVVKQEELLKSMNLRFRNLRTGPEGYLYLSTDDGKLARLIPQ